MSKIHQDDWDFMDDGIPEGTPISEFEGYEAWKVPQGAGVEWVHFEASYGEMFLLWGEFKADGDEYEVSVDMQTSEGRLTRTNWRVCRAGKPGIKIAEFVFPGNTYDFDRILQKIRDRNTAKEKKP